MMPSTRPRIRLLLQLLGLTLTGFAFGLLLGGRTALAQTDRPGLVTEALQRRYATRHLLPFTAPGGRAGSSEASLRVTNTGWHETQVLVVELAPATAQCAADFDASRVISVHCESGLARFESRSIPLSGQDSLALVYSLDPSAVADACQSFAPVRRGALSLAAWETSVQQAAPGEPLAVLGEARADAALSGLAGLTGLPLPAAQTARLAVVKGLAAIPAGEGRLRVVNASADCATIENRIGLPSATDDCQPARPTVEALGAFGSRDLAPGFGSAEMAALTQLRSGRQPSDLLALGSGIDLRTADLWLRQTATTLSAAESRILAFPLAISPVEGSTSELWVSNAHVTATVQINLAMSDGNGQVIRNYNDPVGLCPGASRVYDILDLAGEIPPTGRGAAAEPYLSLRVEGTSSQISDFAPIAGTLIVRQPGGGFAYGGLNLPFEASVIRPRRDQNDGSNAIAAVLPGLKLRYGPERLTSFVAVAGLGNVAGDNAVAIDFYDTDGNLVVTNFQRPLRPVAFFDLTQVVLRDGGGQRLPDGFVGTAVIRGQRNPGAAFGAIALERPAAGDRQGAGGGPAVHAYASQLIRLWPDPDAPTPTAGPTRALPTPTSQTPPATDEPTPTGEATRPVAPGSIWLPLLMQTWSGAADRG